MIPTLSEIVSWNKPFADGEAASRSALQMPRTILTVMRTDI